MMAWLLTLILGLAFLVQPATTHGLISTQPSNEHNLSSQKINNFQETFFKPHQSRWIKGRVDNRLYRDLLLPLWPNFSINDGSGDGSGLQESLEVMMPSSGVLEMDTFIPDRAEKLDFGGIFPSAPPAPQRLTQHIVNADPDIILANKNSGLYQATSTMPVQLTTPTHTTFINNSERMNKDQPLLTTTKPTKEKNFTVNSTPVYMYVETFTTNDQSDHSTSLNVLETNNNENIKTFPETKHASSTQTFSSITKPEMVGHNGPIVMQSDFIQESFDNLMVKEKHYVTNHTPTATPPLQTGQLVGEESTSEHIPIELSSTNPSVMQAQTNSAEPKNKGEKSKRFGGLFGLLTESSQAGTTSCIQGPCVASIGNITRLQWEDLKRTLTFAWDLHVYGSAILFLLVVVAATYGVIGGAQMLHPLSESFTLANILLLLAGVFRFAQFIIDPYGTRNILPRPILTAVYNLPVPLLLWAQATLSLLCLRQERLSPHPASPQRLSVNGGLAALHCTVILLADLLSSTLSPALPLMMQTITVCWGLPLCLGIFFQSLKQLSSSHRTPVPRWSAPMRLLNSVRRVLLLCALLGVFSCALQIYGYLWLYGLLGDWRRFGWVWWLGQLWARLLELAWSFSLLLLGSQVFWRPQGGKGKPEQRKRTNKKAQKEKEMSRWNRLLERLPMGPWIRPDRNWAELLPNNWKGQKQARENVSHSTTQNQAAPATPDTTVQDNTGGGVLYNSNNDCYATPVWTTGMEWQEHECLLSLIEVDLHPPSPVNLSHSKDSALPQSHLLGVGTIFTPSSPSWNQYEGIFEGNNKSSTVPTNRAYRWALDSCLSPISTHYFGTTVQHTQVSVIEPLASLTPETIRKVWERHSAIPLVTGDDDWSSIESDDDITSL